MAPKLRAFVHGVVDDAGNSHSFGPSDDVPAWARKLITNPKAWADDEATLDVAGDTPPTGDAGTGGSPDGGSGETPPTGGPEVPPRGGAGSGRDAWAEFAAAKDFDVADDAGRDDIIAALEEAGVIAPEAE